MLFRELKENVVPLDKLDLLETGENKDELDHQESLEKLELQYKCLKLYDYIIYTIFNQ